MSKTFASLSLARHSLALWLLAKKVLIHIIAASFVPSQIFATVKHDQGGNCIHLINNSDQSAKCKKTHGEYTLYFHLTRAGHLLAAVNGLNKWTLDSNFMELTENLILVRSSLLARRCRIRTYSELVGQFTGIVEHHEAISDDSILVRTFESISKTLRMWSRRWLTTDFVAVASPNYLNLNFFVPRVGLLE
ncbi:hypothetical protein R3P38DRAFT_2784851 [Favolaschia claudopus]|uniref:Uncharacterized protein n=1 Tax=Favolaschia claudopus TaxID=2862362 RepID=A0AAW0AU32_9AGAR